MTSVTSDTDPDRPRSRRDRLREELVADIKSVARRQLAEHGPVGVSWRAIAREVGMSPAALYTYFESLEDLYTALIADSFWALADAVGEGIALVGDRGVIDRLSAGVAAYREWSLRHPEQFRLIFQSEIPGYAAPQDGPTVDANLASSAHFLALIVEGWSTGELDQPDPGPAVDPAEMNEKFGLSLTPDQMRVAMTAWGTLHGVTQLEVNNHMGSDWLDNDAVMAGLLAELARLLHGVPPTGEVPSLVRAHFDRTSVRVIHD